MPMLVALRSAWPPYGREVLERTDIARGNAVGGAGAPDRAYGRRRRVGAIVPANAVLAVGRAHEVEADAEAPVRTAVLARDAAETACDVLRAYGAYVSGAASRAVGRVARADVLAVPANPGVGDAVAAIHRRRALLAPQPAAAAVEGLRSLETLRRAP